MLELLVLVRNTLNYTAVCRWMVIIKKKLFLLLESFSHQLMLMVFLWSLSDSKSPQVSRTLLSILNNAVVWIVSTSLLISKSSSPFTNPLVTVPRAPITIGVTIIFMFHSFFNSQARLRYLSFFLLYFNFTLK